MVLMPKESGELITKLAKHVFIEEEGVKKIVDLVLDSLAKNPSPQKKYFEPNFHPSASHPHAADWVFVIDVLNFCFWPAKSQWIVNGEHGYYALCAAIKRAVDKGKPFYDPKYYGKLTREELAHIFRKDEPGCDIPLLDERLKHLTESAKILLDKYNGSFAECIKKCDHSAQKLLQLIVTEFDNFRDEAHYRGHHVSIYKRAQILIGDIWACFDGKGLGRFDDIDTITMFADYRVPQVLLHFGALRYNEHILNMLKNDGELEYGTEEEIEIRGVTIECVERITEQVKNALKQQPELEKKVGTVNATMVDYILWDYRRECAEEMKKTPFHKTRCVYY